ncbi:TraC family protein [Kordiimonas aquimaris]|uniref:TraC family protein n=1 Tax=Kordiimonas aquimaris TaxID=707591 RepID=UPI0021CFFE8D|nr:TraC family protein [Kordiimonas aquimaris]
MFEFLYGRQGGDTQKGWRGMLEREPLSDFLPYRSYSETEQLYNLTDGSVGHLWEILPVAYAGEQILAAVKRLLNMDMPADAQLQFILYGDPYIDDYLDSYQSLKTRNRKVVQDNVASYVKFWRENSGGARQLRGIPLRNFRVFIALKSGRALDQDVVASIRESLAKFGVRSVPAEGPDGLLAILRRLFSDMRVRKNGTCEDGKPLRKQMLGAGEPYMFKGACPKIGAQYARCFTPQAIPKQVSAEKINRLFGGIMGIMDDTRQITAPFLYSMTVFFKPTKTDILTKAHVTGLQKGGAKFSTDLERRTEEFQWISDVIESGEKVLRFVPIMWVFGWDQDQVREAVSRAKGMWNDLGFAVQDESYLNKPLFIMSLPFGFYDEGNNLRTLDRDFMAPVSTLAHLIPVQGDYRGAGKPSMMLVGRKGQLVTVDLFDPGNNNQNFLVSAESGAGKSFFLNYLTNQYYAQNSKIRIIDIGYSYQKMCSLMGGRFLDIGADAKLCINPFDFKAGDKEELDLGIQTASAALGLMCSSASGRDLDEESLNLLRLASRWVIETGRGATGVDAAREFLATFPDQIEAFDEAKVAFLIDRARALAFNLQPFCSEGEYGSYFNGKSTFDISKDDFVVVELERLRQFPQLFGVIVLQVMNAVTQDLYLGDRSVPNFILFEEAAAFLKENLAGGRAKNFKSVIEAGYRRARKYNGAIGTVIQSVMDLKSFGDVGEVIWDNAATKFLLQGETYGRAAAAKVIDHEGFALELLKSVTNNKPNYSEVFIDSPHGIGIGRLVVDPHTYWMNTSAADEVARYSKLVAVGLTPAQAIEALVNGTDQALLAKRLTPPGATRSGIKKSEEVRAAE